MHVPIPLINLNKPPETLAFFLSKFPDDNLLFINYPNEQRHPYALEEIRESPDILNQFGDHKVLFLKYVGMHKGRPKYRVLLYLRDVSFDVRILTGFYRMLSFLASEGEHVELFRGKVHSTFAYSQIPIVSFSFGMKEFHVVPNHEPPLVEDNNVPMQVQGVLKIIPRTYLYKEATIYYELFGKYVFVHSPKHPVLNGIILYDPAELPRIVYVIRNINVSVMLR